MVKDRTMQLPLFDTSTLLRSFADLHTSKRGDNERTGVHGWHPYYAGYSEQFAADVLSMLGKPGDLVLDPWNGSGTTTLVAQRCGYPSLGIEINPVMVFHAQAKNLQSASLIDEILAEAQRLTGIARRLVSERVLDRGTVRDWVDGEPLAALLMIRDAIKTELETSFPPNHAQAVLRNEAKKALYPSQRQAFLLSALFQVLRQVGRFSQGSNPTWLVLDDETESVSADSMFALFVEMVRAMLRDVGVAAQGVEEIAPSWTMTGDSRALLLEDALVDLIVTSPPYCTRIDYAFATKPELLLLGHEEGEFDMLRRSTMGAPVIVDKSITMRQVWGTHCRDFLHAVAQHPSKASQSYYLPTYLQYFHDAELSLREIHRVLKSGRQAVIVVQSSYYKEVELPLGDIYVEMAQRLGFEAKVARRETVRQHMAHVNTKSRQYVKNKVYYEDTILLRR